LSFDFHAAAFSLSVVSYASALCLSRDHLGTAVLSDPSLDSHGLFCDFEHSSSGLNTDWAIATETGLTTVGQVDTLVVSVVVVVMVMTARDPLNGGLLLQGPKEASVNCLATDSFSPDAKEV